MAKRLTARQEQFAMAVANGANYVEAYRKAYSTANCSYDSIKSQASRVAGNVAVSEAIDTFKFDIKQKQIEAAAYTKNQAFEEFEQIRQQAIIAKHFPAALKAIENKCKLADIFESKDDDHFDTASLRHVEKEISELLEYVNPALSVTLREKFTAQEVEKTAKENKNKPKNDQELLLEFSKITFDPNAADEPDGEEDENDALFKKQKISKRIQKEIDEGYDK